jgi:hypothetical protein
MKPGPLLDLLYECALCHADLRSDSLPVAITIRASGRDFAFSHQTRMIPEPDGFRPPDHVRCPACGMLFVFDSWSSVITDTIPVDDLLPSTSPTAEVDLFLGLLAAFGSFGRFSAQVTEAIAAGGPVPQTEEFSLLLARIGDLERAGMA